MLINEYYQIINVVILFRRKLVFNSKWIIHELPASEVISLVGLASRENTLFVFEVPIFSLKKK